MTHPRLKAALCTTVLAASLATPTLDSALASSPVPALPDVSAALTGAGISSTNATAILTELGSLEGVAPGGSLPLLSLSSLDNSLTTLNGSLLGSLLTPVLSLLTALNPAAPSNLTSTLADLSQIGSAPGASTAVVQAVNELTATLTTAGLGQLLTQVSGLTTLQNTSALSALAGLQSLSLGGNVPAGSLAPVATVLTTMVGDTSDAGAKSSLTSAAGILNSGSAITPTQLLAAIGDVQSAAGVLPAPLSGVATALADQLSASTSLFGQLASVGSLLSSGSISGALTGLGSLPSLTPGASVPSGSLASLAGVLTTLASEPGVPGGAVTTLTNAASTLNGGAIDPTSLLALLGNLQGVSGLPAPLDGLLSGVTSALGSSGSIFGGVPGLSSGQVTGALSALGGLPGLSAGSSVPSGLLAPVAGILTQVASQPGVPGPAATALDGVAASLNGSGAIDPAGLLSLIGTLQGVSGLPAPLGTVVSGVTGALGTSGSIFGAVPGLSSGQVTGALTALGDLPGLSAGSSIPGGLLAPVGGILSQVAAQPGVPSPVAATLATVAGTLSGAGTIDPSSLQGLITTLQGLTGSLPAPLSTVVSGITGNLAGSGSLAAIRGGGGTGSGGTGSGGTGSGGTGSGGTGSGGTGSGGTGSGGTGGSGSGGSGTGSGGTGGTGGTGSGSGGYSGHATISRVQRQGNVITVTLHCTASATRTCLTTVSATQAGAQRGHATVVLYGGSTKRVKLRLPAKAVAALLRHRHAATIRVTARTGSYRTSKTLR